MAKPAVAQPHGHAVGTHANRLGERINVPNIRGIIDARLTRDKCANAHVTITIDCRSCCNAYSSIAVAMCVVDECAVAERAVLLSVDIVKKRKPTEYPPLWCC